MRAVSLRWLSCTLLLTACGLDTSGTGEAVPGGGSAGVAGDSSVGGTGGGGAGGKGGSAGTAGPGGASGKGGSAGTSGGAGGAAGKPETCGDGTRNGDEECDGQDFGPSTCASELPGTKASGSLKCNDCVIDTSACLRCGDGAINGDEKCDGDDLGGKSCGDVVGTGSTGELSCRADCTLDATQCSAAQGCNDGTRNGNEQCDTSDLGGATCDSLHPGGKAAGDLSCTNNCVIDDSKCRWCGDGARNNAEQCDGTDLGDQSCKSLHGDSAQGELSCDLGCQLVDTCTFCGDGKVNNGEACDGASLNGATCGDNQTGTPTCNGDCTVNHDGCKTQHCFDNATNEGESDLDCGAACAEFNRKCADRKSCGGGGDCQSGVCTGGKCEPSSCKNGNRDDQETDKDCGGGECSARCSSSALCTSNTDCTTTRCADVLGDGTSDKKCVEPDECLDNNSCSGGRKCLGKFCLSNYQISSKVAECPGGWTRVNGSCYKRFPAPSAWIGAFKGCRSIGANLASLSSAQLDGINAEPALKLAGGEKVWIGLACDGGSGPAKQCGDKNQWQMVDDSKAPTDRWAGGFPNPNNLCGYLGGEADGKALFRSQACSPSTPEQNDFSYLCELKL